MAEAVAASAVKRPRRNTPRMMRSEIVTKATKKGAVSAMVSAMVRFCA